MKNNLSKALCTFLILISFFINTVSVNAECINKTPYSDYYIETTIVDEIPMLVPFAQVQTHTITKTKTSTIKATDGTSLWSVSITATFTYDGTTSKCISCSHNAISYIDSWKIQSVNSHKNGNSATATAVARHIMGNSINNYTQSVTLTCNKNGNVS